MFVKVGPKIVHRIDLVKINSKSECYESFRELRRDIAWFVHNCRIIYPEHSTIVKAAKTLIDSVDDEVFSLQTCSECYENAYKHPINSFVMPCKSPHPIIWAKVSGYSFWPAKLMSVDNGTIHVRFFGDHSVANLTENDCLLYSSESPDTVSATISAALHLALTVCLLSNYSKTRRMYLY